LARRFVALQQEPNVLESSVDPGPPTLAIVVPCFNEQETLAFTVDTLLEHLDRMIAERLVTARSFLFFVDDGSRDATWPLLTEAYAADRRVLGLRLSRNFGHQAALLAGLTAVHDKADVSISIDADLQQEPEAMDRFIAAYREGANVVLGVRRDRASDGPGKKVSASGFYWLMRRMGVDVVPNHADYRLLDNKATKALLSFPETALFIRGMTSMLGFDTRQVLFDVRERQYGKSKYSLFRMLRFAVHAITSFSVVPLRIIAILGVISFLVSLGMVGFVAWSALFGSGTVPGWASTVIPIYFMAGVQLLSIGVLGEYVGKIYTTVQHRPRWIEWERLDDKQTAEQRVGLRA
jgi:glycosyltransferase involved in cell wall biosynthesis